MGIIVTKHKLVLQTKHMEIFYRRRVLMALPTPLSLRQDSFCDYPQTRGNKNADDKILFIQLFYKAGIFCWLLHIRFAYMPEVFTFAHENFVRKMHTHSQSRRPQQCFPIFHSLENTRRQWREWQSRLTPQRTKTTRFMLCIRSRNFAREAFRCSMLSRGRDDWEVDN